MSKVVDSLESVLARVAEIARANSDAEIARALGVKSQTLANWRARGSVPFEALFEFAQRHGLSLDYVFFSREPKYRRRTEIDVGLLVSVGSAVEFFSPPEAKAWSHGERFHYIALVYNRLLRLPEDTRRAAVEDEVRFMYTALRKAGDWPSEMERLMERAPTPERPRRSRTKSR